MFADERKRMREAAGRFSLGSLDASLHRIERPRTSNMILLNKYALLVISLKRDLIWILLNHLRNHLFTVSFFRVVEQIYKGSLRFQESLEFYLFKSCIDTLFFSRLTPLPLPSTFFPALGGWREASGLDLHHEAMPLRGLFWGGDVWFCRWRNHQSFRGCIFFFCIYIFLGDVLT